MEKERSKRTALQLAVYGVSGAVVAVATLFLRIPGLSPTGYVNFGDAFIFLFGVVFGPTTGLIAGGVGSAIADLVGFPAYAPFTLIIKGLEGLLVGGLAHTLFTRSQNKHVRFAFTLVAMAVAGLEMVALYCFPAMIFAGSAAAGAAEIVPNLIQAGVSIAIAAVILFATNLATSLLSRTVLPDPIEDALHHRLAKRKKASSDAGEAETDAGAAETDADKHEDDPKKS